MRASFFFSLFFREDLLKNEHFSTKGQARSAAGFLAVMRMLERGLIDQNLNPKRTKERLVVSGRICEWCRRKGVSPPSARFICGSCRWHGVFVPVVHMSHTHEDFVLFIVLCFLVYVGEGTDRPASHAEMHQGAACGEGEIVQTAVEE